MFSCIAVLFKCHFSDSKNMPHNKFYHNYWPGRQKVNNCKQIMAGENIFYSYLARCNREPWLLLEFIDLLPDLLELGPDSLEILQLLESHLDPLLTRTHRTCQSREKNCVHKKQGTVAFTAQSFDYVIQRIHISFPKGYAIQSQFISSSYKIFWSTDQTRPEEKVCI